jgi:hypothetical protein
MGLDSVELVMKWEEAFSISIPDRVAGQIVTPAMAAEAIAKILEEEGLSMERDEIDRIIKLTTLDQLGITEKDYRIDARFVEDFGMD